MINFQDIIKRGFITKEEQDEVMDDKYLTKVDIVNNQDDGSEGIWCSVITDKNLKLYNSNSFEKEIYVVLSNHALEWMPNPTWGMVVKATTKGKSRPIVQAEEQEQYLAKIYKAYKREWEKE